MEVEAPTENFLTYNSLGGAIVRQSDLSSYARCGMQKYYNDLARQDPDAIQRLNLSATVFGSVLHFAMMQMEQLRASGDPEALPKAQATFRHYWHPENTGLLPGVQPVNEWLPRETWNGLEERGRLTLAFWYDSLSQRTSESLLALEYQFAVPITVNGRTHTITGTIDRLTLGRYYRKPIISIEDYKTGRRPDHLRYNVQGSVYAYATTQDEFWLGPGDELWDNQNRPLDVFGENTRSHLEEVAESWGFTFRGEHSTIGRRFRWIDMKQQKVAEGGWRTARDYARVGLAVDAYVRACEAGVYTLTATGEICRYCEFREICGGVGLPADGDGRPQV